MTTNGCFANFVCSEANVCRSWNGTVLKVNRARAADTRHLPACCDTRLFKVNPNFQFFFNKHSQGAILRLCMLAHSADSTAVATLNRDFCVWSRPGQPTLLSLRCSIVVSYLLGKVQTVLLVFWPRGNIVRIKDPFNLPSRNSIELECVTQR